MSVVCRLGISPIDLAALLCKCVFESNAPLIRALEKAGADVNAGDYDARTALHIAAAEGESKLCHVQYSALVHEGLT